MFMNQNWDASTYRQCMSQYVCDLEQVMDAGGVAGTAEEQVIETVSTMAKWTYCQLVIHAILCPTPMNW